MRLITSAALLWGLVGSPAVAQPPYRQELIAGFSNLDVGDASKPEMVDLDGDGDLDWVVGTVHGGLRLLTNKGSASAPALVATTGAANPLTGIEVGFSASPELVDLDGDGDRDVVLGNGESERRLRYLENTGSASQPAFFERTGAGDPFRDFVTGYLSEPDLADLDGDGDLDMLVGDFTGRLSYFENTGSSTLPVFSQRTGSANPVAGFEAASQAHPALADLDDDGDQDLVVGSYGGLFSTSDVFFLENTGSSTAPSFVERVGAANPFWSFGQADEGAPDLVDLDADGDLDAIVGELGGHFVFFRSTFADVFSDGFESGDLSVWSAAVP